MKETNEFVNALFDTAVTTIVALGDGFQMTDIGAFINVAMQWPTAIAGLKEGFSNEILTVTPEQVEELFDTQKPKLLGAGLNPLLVGAILSQFKGIYYGIAISVQTKKENLTEGN